MLEQLERLIVVTGHYGSGKTNLSINLALKYREQGERVMLADLDVVNPYFRTADFVELCGKRGIELVLPNYANTSLDIPSLNPRLDAALRGDGTLIIDVGGDDAGAFALGRYSADILARDYSMLYVVNRYRHLGGDTAEAVRLLGDIETASRLRVTHIVNNSNLGPGTTLEELRASHDFAAAVCAQADKPLAFTAIKSDIYEEIPQKERAGYLPVERLVCLLWETEIGLSRQ